MLFYFLKSRRSTFLLSFCLMMISVRIGFEFWLHRLVVRTLGSQPRNTGSTPVGATRFGYLKYEICFSLPRYYSFGFFTAHASTRPKPVQLHSRIRRPG